jgi:4-hydroxythreonine-4-phosphate dehydrogenase
MLAAFGVRATAIGSAAALEHWAAAPGEVAVCDAASDADLDAIGRWWRDHPDVLLAGTSAVLAAAVERVPGVDAASVPAGPRLVVAGSLSPVARAQIDVAVLGGAAMTADHEAAVAHLVAGRHVIVTSDASRVAAAVVAGLASAAHAILADERSRSVVSAVVVLGGDTAAIVLGDALVAVLGTVGPGTAVVESLLCDVPIITRAGGFGDPDGLVRLL